MIEERLRQIFGNRMSFTEACIIRAAIPELARYSDFEIATLWERFSDTYAAF